MFKCGLKENSNWKEYPQRFNNLMKAISQSGIKESLEALDIGFCEVSEEDARSVLNSLGMMNIVFLIRI